MKDLFNGGDGFVFLDLDNSKFNGNEEDCKISELRIAKNALKDAILKSGTYYIYTIKQDNSYVISIQDKDTFIKQLNIGNSFSDSIQGIGLCNHNPLEYGDDNIKTAYIIETGDKNNYLLYFNRTDGYSVIVYFDKIDNNKNNGMHATISEGENEDFNTDNGKIQVTIKKIQMDNECEQSRTGLIHGSIKYTVDFEVKYISV